MTEARFTLTLPSRKLDDAQSLADGFDAVFAVDVLAVTVNETDEANALWNTVAYFNSEADAATAAAQLGIEHGEIAQVPDVDWVRRSLEGLAPVVAGRFFLHGSHDRAKRRVGGHSFEIDAGTAFGTGHHGTTSGCLAIFDALLKARKFERVFDLGCGTGVLALAAAKLTSSKVLATDIDAEAVRVTLNNATLNHVRPKLQGVTAAGLHHPAIRAAAPFDLIFANILARPLVTLAHGISNLLQPGGVVILSGLTHEQLRWVSAAYRARGLRAVHTIRNENWIATAMCKPSSNAKRPKTISGRFESHTKAPGWERDL